MKQLVILFIKQLQKEFIHTRSIEEYFNIISAGEMQSLKKQNNDNISQYKNKGNISQYS